MCVREMNQRMYRKTHQKSKKIKTIYVWCCLLVVIIFGCYMFVLGNIFYPNTTEANIQIQLNLQDFPDTLDVIIYKKNNISNKLNQFNEYWTLYSKHSKLECKESIYKIIRHRCCLISFTINYLYSLGFTQIDEIDEKSNIKTMRNNGNNNLGCYGLQIIQRSSNKANRFNNLYTKTKSYSTIMTYCNKQNIKYYCKQWLPNTYNLMIKTQRIHFFKNKTNECLSKYKWIIKNDKHRGNGITFITNKNINYIKNFYLTKQEEQQIQSIPDTIICADSMDDNSVELSRESIAQELILNTHKIKDCNFHIRSWLFVANLNDPFIVFYVDSYIIRATHPSAVRSNRHFSMGTHLDDNDLNDDDWQWSMQQFNKYFGQRIDIINVIQQIKNITNIIILASYDEYVDYNNKNDDEVQHYLPLVFDFLITTDNQLKFLELNLLPGYFDVDTIGNGKCFHKWQCVLGKRMMEEIIDIQIEIAIKKRNKHKIKSLDSVNTFDIVLWKE
eukprot:173307_1